MKDRSHDDAMAELLREDPAFAAQYLQYALEEGNQSDQFIALRQTWQAFDDNRKLAE